MAQSQRRSGSDAATFDGGMKGLLDLFGRGPTPVRVSLYVERLLSGWREALDPDSYAERLDVLREALAEGISQTEEAAADVDPASKAEARQAAAVVASMRTAYEAMQAGAVAPA